MVEAGRNTLVGCDVQRIAQAALEVRMEVESVWPYGDGRTGERIIGLFTIGSFVKEDVHDYHRSV